MHADDILTIAMACRWWYWSHAMIIPSWNSSWPLIGEILTGDPNCEKDRDVNENHRQGQTKELLRFIESSCCNSDLVLLAGDFNFDKTHESYQLVTGANFEDTGSGEGDKRSTWGHPDNKSGNSPPHLLDYVFVRSNQEQIQVKARSTIPEKAFQWVLQIEPSSIIDPPWMWHNRWCLNDNICILIEIPQPVHILKWEKIYITTGWFDITQ